MDFPAIPDEPTLDDARNAIETMLEPVQHFSFVATWDRAVWLAALITPLVRPFLPSAPMFVFDAPVRGAGKGKLVNVISTVATGGWPATMSFVEDGDEQRTTATWLATGNNVVIVGDLTRRVLMCRIDPAVERPEERSFPFEPVALAQSRRPHLVAAVLTLLRAHAVAGRPQGGLTPFGSFEDWSHVVRAALVWAGEKDLLQGRQAVHAADTELDLFRVFITSWFALYGDKPMSVRAAVNGASEQRSEAAEALRVTAEELTEESDSVRQRRLLGLKIAKAEGRVVDGLRFMAGTMSGGSKRWRLQRVESSEARA